MTPRVDVAPALLRWACERAGWTLDHAAARFPRFPDWIATEHPSRPTLKQLERFAHATHTPIGYLFLSEPPVEQVPIPDCRTMRDAALQRPSPDMLDTIYVCQQRQAWYREHAQTHGDKPLPFVGSAKLTDDVVAAASLMRAALGLEVAQRTGTWTDALRAFVAQAEALGVLVMVSGIVGTNTRRVLDPREFRGFALVDDLAPVVFVNGADAKAAQMFTLAHELAHVWLGESALSDVSPESKPTAPIEQWCHAVAELLVTRDDFATPYDRSEGASPPQGARLARVSRRFAEAICLSAWEGRASFIEAMRLLQIRKRNTFYELGASLGLEVHARSPSSGARA